MFDWLCATTQWLFGGKLQNKLLLRIQWNQWFPNGLYCGFGQKSGKYSLLCRIRFLHYVQSLTNLNLTSQTTCSPNSWGKGALTQQGSDRFAWVSTLSKPALTLSDEWCLFFPASPRFWIIKWNDRASLSAKDKRYSDGPCLTGFALQKDVRGLLNNRLGFVH